MKILCVADETEPLIYSSQAKTLFRDCDLAISAGDLPVRYYDYIMTILGKDFFYVYGNHNLEHFDQVMRSNTGRLDGQPSCPPSGAIWSTAGSCATSAPD